MNEWLVRATELAVTVIDGMALLLVVWSTAEAFLGGIRLAVTGTDGHRRRAVWLKYGRWLVAVLTFQLAADIVETSIRSDWQAIGQLGAVAVIRTFLNYFLERDIAEALEKQREDGAGKSAKI